VKAAIVSIVKQIAPDLQYADLQDVVSAAMVKAPSCGNQKAVRYALSDWLRDQIEIPQPVEDVELRRELQHARRTVRAASDADLAKWDSLLARLPEREKDVAIRLAAGYSERDICADLRLSKSTAHDAIKRLRRRYGDKVLWFVIIDALQELPDTKAARGEYVSDLAEYRRPTRPDRRDVFVGRKKTTRSFARCWNDSVTLQPTSPVRLRPAYWFPGIPIRPAWGAIQRRQSRTGGAYAVFLLPDDQQPVTVDTPNRRELAGLERGERFYFENRKHGLMLSIPVIVRNTDLYQ
jgi:DNA-binding CsgD family transcriptional regulator